ncbi:hypothetical protein [Prauserella flava]|uniref:hypothetical protein n=1 Tax=Prauserella flava TaxID=577679 RepID=UPI002164E42F|nr:hypothetical protein [Prauserella flava]
MAAGPIVGSSVIAGRIAVESSTWGADAVAAARIGSTLAPAVPESSTSAAADSVERDLAGSSAPAGLVAPARVSTVDGDADDEASDDENSDDGDAGDDEPASAARCEDAASPPLSASGESDEAAWRRPPRDGEMPSRSSTERAVTEP